MENVYFFDSYALIEIILGNLNYKPYIRATIMTTKLNIFEVYHGLMRDIDEKEADKFLEKYYLFAIDFNSDDIRNSAKFKIENKKKGLSMADCIGFIIAKRLCIKFLTGDKEFKDMENVEFVK